MKNVTFFLLLFTPVLFFSQYLLKNEEVVFSFTATNGKLMYLVKDKDDKSLQYRFGTKKKVEMQFPAERNEGSWKKFQYNSYNRGGGKQNSGMEIDNLRFKNKGANYLLYRTYHAEDESFSAGIIIEYKGKKTRINGLYQTVKGCICNLEHTEKIEKEDIGLDF